MAAIVNLDSAAIASLLKSHNDFRASYGILPLKWNQTIADHAVGWANHSIAFKDFTATDGDPGNAMHGDHKGLGQNLMWKYSSDKPKLNYTGLVSGWTSEVVPSAPGGYNHASQVLWGSTTDVGCAMGAGPNPEPNPSNIARNNAIILVCDYYPAGNIQGSQWNTVGGKLPNVSVTTAGITGFSSASATVTASEIKSTTVSTLNIATNSIVLSTAVPNTVKTTATVDKTGSAQTTTATSNLIDSNSPTADLIALAAGVIPGPTSFSPVSTNIANTAASISSLISSINAKTSSQIAAALVQKFQPFTDGGSAKFGGPNLTSNSSAKNSLVAVIITSTSYNISTPVSFAKTYNGATNLLTTAIPNGIAIFCAVPSNITSQWFSIAHDKTSQTAQVSFLTDHKPLGTVSFPAKYNKKNLKREEDGFSVAIASIPVTDDVSGPVVTSTISATSVTIVNKAYVAPDTKTNKNVYASAASAQWFGFMVVIFASLML